jgi:putative transposase
MEQLAVRKTFKYKLKPTSDQERALERVLLLCCRLYNTALEQRQTAYERCGISLSCYDQEAELKAIRAEMPEYAGIHSHVLQNVLARLDKAFQAFFRRLREGQTPGYPRFHGAQRYHSFTYKQFGNGARLDNGILVLSKIGRMVLRWSRPLEGTPKTVTISREADGWYACFSCAEVPTHSLPLTGQETGIDLGLASFATLADGSQLANPRLFRVAERNLKRMQRRVTRRKLGSIRRKKAAQMLAKAHLKVKRQRQDFHHKQALALVRQFDTIYHEDLQTANMVKNHHLAKSISDAGWRAFLSILCDKAACAGRSVVAVPPAFTSQQCSGCGRVVWKALSVRWHQCPYPDCGTSLHRDQNAALNIWQVGRNGGAGQAPQALTQRVAAYVA